ncbi:YcxB family protein [Chryseobacterium foetidum]|uniref:YcxB family protein n=1 Tax=Chryseobacterium foetidum TaxID=2951057 RepID=UPI0021CA31C5|nr:YcxB family protein [Chryseobacterium foetidum]
MSDGKKIIIKPKRQDFEEIYFSGNKGSLFLSRDTRGKTFTLIIIALILGILFFFKDDLSKEKFGILYFVSFLFLLTAVFLSVSVNKVSRWKKQVNSYLFKLENCKIYEVIFDQQFFTVNIDGEKETSEWKDFQAFEINEEYIALEGKYSYMFPKKSMSGSDFSVLKKMVESQLS